MERLTDKCWRNLDPWECCGQEKYCTRDCHEKGGCTHGCIVPKLYEKLAKYEDLEEQGLLLRLPCRIGGTVYHYCEEFGGILEYTISHIDISTYASGGFDAVISGGAFEKDDLLDDFEEDVYSFQKEFFQTFEEAKQALTRLEIEVSD